MLKNVQAVVLSLNSNKIILQTIFLKSQNHVNSQFYCTQSRKNLNWNNKLPSVVYIPHPWKFFINKIQIIRLKLFWDRYFKENEFIRGAKKAAAIITNLIREKDVEKINDLVTPLGYIQIAKDLELSKDDPRLPLIQFRSEDMKKAVPLRVLLVKRNGKKHCAIDMHFIGLRNINDFDKIEDRQNMQDLLKKYENFIRKKNSTLSSAEFFKFENKLTEMKNSTRIIFAEILIRFYRDYSKPKLENWSISYCKVIAFDILAIK